MVGPDTFRVVARLLRERAVCLGVGQEQAAKALGLAAYFEKLAVDPCSAIADRRYG